MPTATLSEAGAALLQPPVFAVVSTVCDSGQPQSSVVWLRAETDGTIVFSTIRGRLKTLNMEREPRVSVCAYDPADPYSYVEVRGTAALTEEGGDELIDEMSRAYTGRPWTPRPGEVRVVVRVTPTRVIEHVTPQSAKRSS